MFSLAGMEIGHLPLHSRQSSRPGRELVGVPYIPAAPCFRNYSGKIQQTTFGFEVGYGDDSDQGGSVGGHMKRPNPIMLITVGSFFQFIPLSPELFSLLLCNDISNKGNQEISFIFSHFKIARGLFHDEAIIVKYG